MIEDQWMVEESRISRVKIGVLLEGLLTANLTVGCQARLVDQRATDSRIWGIVAAVDHLRFLGCHCSVPASEESGCD